MSTSPIIICLIYLKLSFLQKTCKGESSPEIQDLEKFLLSRSDFMFETQFSISSCEKILTQCMHANGARRPEETVEESFGQAGEMGRGTSASGRSKRVETQNVMQAQKLLAETSLTSLKRPDSPQKIDTSKVRPVDVQEAQLAICALP